jgi:hypothetical protein
MSRRQIAHPIRSVRSEKVGDYITWLTLGVAAFGVALTFFTGVLV